MKALAFLSQTGESGKTTLAVHTAVAAQEDGERVIVVDTDLHKSATTWSEARVGDAPAVVTVAAAALQSVKLLLLEDANINLEDRDGNTALTIAETSSGAPYAGFHDSPGWLDQVTANKLAIQARRDSSAFVLLLKHAGSK